MGGQFRIEFSGRVVDTILGIVRVKVRFKSGSMSSGTVCQKERVVLCACASDLRKDTPVHRIMSYGTINQSGRSRNRFLLNNNLCKRKSRAHNKSNDLKPHGIAAVKRLRVMNILFVCFFPSNSTTTTAVRERTEQKKIIAKQYTILA